MSESLTILPEKYCKIFIRTNYLFEVFYFIFFKFKVKECFQDCKFWSKSTFAISWLIWIWYYLYQFAYFLKWFMRRLLHSMNYIKAFIYFGLKLLLNNCISFEMLKLVTDLYPLKCWFLKIINWIIVIY